jgi:hypothetical protein
MATQTAPPATPVSYRIDRTDSILETGGAWDDFARANGGVPGVIGQPLWHFVAGADVRAVWSLLLSRVRTKGEPISFFYRCDAPGVARVLQMELVPSRDGSVTFRSTQLRTAEARTFSGRSDTGSNRGLVSVCGWCARVHVGDTWAPPEQAAQLLGLLDDEQPRLSHGVCDTCARELRAAACA